MHVVKQYQRCTNIHIWAGKLKAVSLSSPFIGPLAEADQDGRLTEVQVLALF